MTALPALLQSLDRHLSDIRRADAVLDRDAGLIALRRWLAVRREIDERFPGALDSDATTPTTADARR